MSAEAILDRPVFLDMPPTNAFLRNLERKGREPVVCLLVTGPEAPAPSERHLCVGCGRHVWVSLGARAEMRRRSRYVPACWQCCGFNDMQEVLRMAILGATVG